MPHRLEKLVQDASGACEELRTFTAGKTYEDLLNDRGLQLILERLFGVLGDGARAAHRWSILVLAPCG